MDTYCKDSEVEFMSINYETIHRDSDMNGMYSKRSHNYDTSASPDVYSTTTIDIDNVRNRDPNSNSVFAISRELTRDTSKARESSSNAVSDLLRQTGSDAFRTQDLSLSRDQRLNRFPELRDKSTKRFPSISRDQSSKNTPLREQRLRTDPQLSKDHNLNRFADMSSDQSLNVLTDLQNHSLSKFQKERTFLISKEEISSKDQGLGRDQFMNRSPDSRNISSNTKASNVSRVDQNVNTSRVLENKGLARTTHVSKESSKRNQGLTRDQILNRVSDSKNNIANKNPSLSTDENMKRYTLINGHSSKRFPEFSREQSLNRKESLKLSPTFSKNRSSYTENNNRNTCIGSSKKHLSSSGGTPDSSRVTRLMKTSTSDANLTRTTQKTSRQGVKSRPRLCRSDKLININVVQQNVAKGVVHSLKLARTGSDSSVDITILTPHPHRQNKEEYRIIQPKRRIKAQDTNSIIEQKKIEANDVIEEKWKQMVNTVQKLSAPDVAKESNGMTRDNFVANNLGGSARLKVYREKSKRNEVNNWSMDSVTQDDEKLNCVAAKKKRIIMRENVDRSPPNQDQHKKGVFRLVLWPSEERKNKTERAKKLLKDSRRNLDAKCSRHVGNNMIHTSVKTSEKSEINRMGNVDSVEETVRKNVRTQEWPPLGDDVIGDKRETETTVDSIHKNSNTVSSNGYKCTTGTPKTDPKDGSTVIHFNLHLPSFTNVPEKINDRYLTNVSFAPRRTVSGLNCEPNFGKALEYRWNSMTSAERLKARRLSKTRRQLSDRTLEIQPLKEQIYSKFSSSDLAVNERTLKREIFLTEPPSKEMKSVRNMKQETNMCCNNVEREVTSDKGRRVASIMSKDKSKTRYENANASKQEAKKNITYDSNRQRYTKTPRQYTTEVARDGVTESARSPLKYLQSRTQGKVKEHEQPRNSYMQATDFLGVSEDCQNGTQEDTGVKRNVENSSKMLRSRPRKTDRSPSLGEYSRPRLTEMFHDKQSTARSSKAEADSEMKSPIQLRDTIETFKEVNEKSSAFEALERFLAEQSSKSLDRRTNSPHASEEKWRESGETTRAKRVASGRSSTKPDASYRNVEYTSDSSTSTLLEGNDNMETDKNYVVFHLNSALSLLGDSSLGIGHSGDMLKAENLIDLPEKHLKNKLSKLREISHKNSIVFKDGNELSEMHAEREYSTRYLGSCETTTIHPKEHKTMHRNRFEVDAGHSLPSENRTQKREQDHHVTRVITDENLPKKLEKSYREYPNKEDEKHTYSLTSIATDRSTASTQSELSGKDEYHDSSYRLQNQKSPSDLSKVPDRLFSRRCSTSRRSLTAHQSVESGDVWLMDERAFSPDIDLSLRSDIDQMCSPTSRSQRSGYGDEDYSLKTKFDRSTSFLVSERDIDTSETESSMSRISVIAAPFSCHDDVESRNGVPESASRTSSYQFTFSNPNIKSWRESCPKSQSLVFSSTVMFDQREKGERRNVEKQTVHSQTEVRSKDDKLNKRDEKLGTHEKKSRTFSETELKRIDKSKIRNTNEEEVSRKTRHTIKEALKDMSGGKNEVNQRIYERDNIEKERNIEKMRRSPQPENKEIEIIKAIKGYRTESKRRRGKYDNSLEREHGDTGKMKDIDDDEMIGGESMVYQVMRAEYKESLHKIGETPKVRRINKKIATLERDLAALSEVTFHSKLKDSDGESSDSETDTSTEESSGEIACFQQCSAGKRER